MAEREALALAAACDRDDDGARLSDDEDAAAG